MQLFALLAAALATTATAAAVSSSPDAQQNHRTPMSRRSAQEIVAQLNLTSNPEKGYYAQTFIDPEKACGGSNRSASTLIYYLLEGSAGDSVWHRVDAAEVWHWYAGAPLTLSLSWDDGKPVERHLLGQDIFAGESPQVVILKDQWQSARSHGNWTLVGTTVAPAFSTDGYDLAPPGWQPKGATSCRR
ncbi:cupin superfamily protein [Cordyceps fumosorosea ARSEF 2679]|uniref:Cupin superfamily protein n=1 Tax=Cordyceps fumosorosea (strain ARSEF 2679) TaxID=1081104 RepID=A0A167R5K4_CORFA|nr:cupin superfamily protein [Cordyceps fumosorosea ARSEF 2679]OAA58292.1 cupin superfamily protein [Cordyceps fumosorosea ARSEF 2679]